MENSRYRCEELATYMLNEQCTLREAATYFGISKSTVHVEVTDRLERTNKVLFRQIRRLLDTNWAEKHIRGGMSTSRKFSSST